MNIRRTVILTLWVLSTGTSSYAVHTQRSDITFQYEKSRDSVTRYVNDFEKPYWITSSEKSIQTSMKSARNALSKAKTSVDDLVTQTMASWLDVPTHKTRSTHKMPDGFINASYDYTSPPRAMTITQIKKRNSQSN